MDVFETLGNNPFFAKSVIPVFIDQPEPAERAFAEIQEELPSYIEAAIPPEITPRSWAEVPLIEMLPAEYRPAAQEIVGRDPNAYRILEDCKAGLYDAFEALERMGLGL